MSEVTDLTVIEIKPEQAPVLYGIGYSSDLERFDKREVAISHGFEVAGCDDFNIGVIDDGRLVSLDWMEKPVGNGKGVSVEKLQIISDAIGLEAS